MCQFNINFYSKPLNLPLQTLMSWNGLAIAHLSHWDLLETQQKKCVEQMGWEEEEEEEAQEAPSKLKLSLLNK